jgi:hypothetical protein
LTSGHTAFKADDAPVVFGSNARLGPVKGFLEHLHSLKHRLIVFCFIVHNSLSG